MTVCKCEENQFNFWWLLLKERTNYTGSGAFTVLAIQFAYFIIIIPSWSEIEDNMAANHEHNKRFADFKYGSFNL